MYPRINFAGKVQIDSATLNNAFENFDINTFAPANKKINGNNWNPLGSSSFRLVDVTVTRVCNENGLCFHQHSSDALAEAPIKGTLFTYRTAQNTRGFKCVAVCRITPIPYDNFGQNLRHFKLSHSHTYSDATFDKRVNLL